MPFKPKHEDPRKNAEGYADPTSYEASENIRTEQETRNWEQDCVDRMRLDKLLATIFYICDLAGFRVKNRIVFEDKRTKRVWR